MVEVPAGGLKVERRGPVAWIFLGPAADTEGEFVAFDIATDAHFALGAALDQLRWDSDVRVVVITGSRHGEFLGVPRQELYELLPTRASGRRRLQERHWSTSRGPARMVYAMALMDQPVIARVNGDAFGFGQSVMFNCDMTVAVETARVCDVRLSMGATTRSADDAKVGPRGALAPSDGGFPAIGLNMPLQRAKEHLMLSPVVTARELADAGVINHAVPAEMLDNKVTEIVDGLLARPADVLARTKRLLNRALLEQLGTFDLSSAYGNLGFFDLSSAPPEDDPQPT
jgi:enoyl-CoA hydratase